ncbi:MAG: tryptophan-rich sensory protein [Bacteroidetes bacterium]|nr:tryptophan-rich sensory protein [Bacteroidota bacterium]
MKKTIPPPASNIPPVVNIIGLIATIAVSYLSVTGLFNHNTMSLQSARYPSLFTPAPWAFSIWGLIYLGLAAFTVYQARNNPEATQLRSRIGSWFLLSCFTNCCWVIAWMYDLPWLSILLMALLLFSLVMIILRTDMELTDPPLRTIAFVWWPFCLYSGWITVALLANIAAVLGRYTSIPPVPLAITLTLLAGTIYLFMTWRRNMREYALVGAYALIAVGVADLHPSPSPGIGDLHPSTAAACTTFIVAGILVLSSGWHAWKNRAYSPFRKRK